jgi:GR25 family glycosyltransferase involved in LPS biosynthesis
MWNFFDGIYCINLYSRDDRMEKCEETFQRLKIPASFFRVHKHPTDGARGCYESHLSIIEKAYYSGYKNVLIFEDDVVESPHFSNEAIRNAINFMQNNMDWEIFYFGHQPDIFYSSSEIISENVMKTQSTLTHAYAISRKFMKKMLKRPYVGKPIDKIYLENNASYALYPMAFYQDDSQSDIATSSPIRGLRLSEMYAYHINYPIIYIILVIFLLLFTFILYVKIK